MKRVKIPKYEDMGNKRIYAGMIDRGVEFMKDEDGALYCSHDWRVHQWPHFPEYVKKKIEIEMLNDPIALEELAKMDGLAPELYDYKFCCCRFGGLDNGPDIDADGNVCQSEYVECSLRGQCKAEGKLCLALKCANGVLTRREMEVLKYVRLEDKLIADQLNVKVDTVITHLINIREKTGLTNKAHLAVFASQKGIILK